MMFTDSRRYFQLNVSNHLTNAEAKSPEFCQSAEYSHPFLDKSSDERSSLQMCTGHGMAGIDSACSWGTFDVRTLRFFKVLCGTFCMKVPYISDVNGKSISPK